MSNVLNDVGSTGSLGGYVSVAGDLMGEFGGAVGAAASASQLSATACACARGDELEARAARAPGLHDPKQSESGYGAQGWSAESGSAADILRSNASNLALDHGIIQMEGSEVESKYLTAASAARKKASAASWAPLSELSAQSSAEFTVVLPALHLARVPVVLSAAR